MHALALVTMLSLPLYPLNPVQQDTVSNMSLHVTAGVDGPTGIISAGPETTAKLEFLFYHPFFIRAAFDYRFGEVTSKVYPAGDLHTATFSGEILYYRGTRKLTGYVGLGLVWADHSFDLGESAGDSLLANSGITRVEVSNALGYRFTAGLRFKHAFSLEIGITGIQPNFVYTRQLGPTSYSEVKDKVRLNTVRVSFGYLFTLKM